MQNDNDTQLDALEKFRQALLEAIGPNDPYPTPDEIAAHKRRAQNRLKFPNLAFANRPRH